MSLPQSRPEGPEIRIACSTGVRSTESLERACALVHTLGFALVDPLAMEGWHIKPSRLVQDPAAEAARLRAVLERNQLACAAINLGFAHNLARCTPKQLAVNLDVVRGACLLAQAAETSILTVGTGSTGEADRRAPVQRLVERLSDLLAQVVAVAAQSGLTVALETHAGSVAVYPEVACELVARCPGLKLTYDPSHFVADGVPLDETLDLLPLAAHVHLRNARVGHFQERMDKGALDLPWMVDQIVDSGYRGAVSIEYIQDCGGIAEGYEVADETLALKQLLLDKGLVL
jgi:sugar phosphate isomerase/epimerase